MPQVYIRDPVYDSIIAIGIKSREAIREYVNDAVLKATLKQKEMEKPKDTEEPEDE